MLRLATPTDIPAIRALINDSVRGLSREVYAPAQIESGLRYVFGPDTQLIADGTYFVIDSPRDAQHATRAALAAAGGWSFRKTHYGGDQMKLGDDPVIDPITEPARIRAFFVHPDFARQGLGRRLYEACARAAQARGFRSLTLSATLPGVPLYVALGFVPLERKDVRLPDGVILPVVRMDRSLP
jgi:GNAT superfamily N-acetyltransferase